MRLLSEAGVADARLVPGHDQLVLNAFRHPRSGHRESRASVVEQQSRHGPTRVLDVPVRRLLGG